MARVHPLTNLLQGPWAIVPERLLELQAVYSRHLQGDAANLADIEARLGRALANEQQDYTVRAGGVAVLDVAGVISPKANLFTKVSGGAAASLLQQQVDSMAADPRVASAILDMDTPGGNVLGIPALAQSIRRLADAKPTVAVCTGSMCSAGYWVGSAANAVFISGLTDFVGSIGVVATHRYDPRASQQVQTTEITVGRYKRVGSENAPLTAEGEAYIRAQIDEIYRVFVETVAANRGVSVEDVLAHMADGRTFVGQQAIDAGLVDGVSTVADMAELLAKSPGQFARRRRAKFGASGITSTVAALALSHAASEPPITHQPGAVTMTHQERAAEFAREHPDAAALLRAEGATGAAAAAAATERARIQSVFAQTMTGHEALIQRLAFDGSTSGPDAAVAVLAAERELSAGRARDIAADTPAPLAAAPIGAAEAALAESAAAAAASAAADTRSPMDQARDLAGAIAKKQAEAGAVGRQLSAVDALALIRKETTHG